MLVQNFLSMSILSKKERNIWKPFHDVELCKAGKIALDFLTALNFLNREGRKHSQEIGRQQKMLSQS